MKCQHLHICVNSFNTLCEDSKCSIVKHIRKAEDIARKERVYQAIQDYKKEQGITNFTDKINVRG